MKYKLLLLDIDGTLRPGSCERVPKENAEAVCAVQKAGVKIAIATGRGRIGVGKGLLRSIRARLLGLRGRCAAGGLQGRRPGPAPPDHRGNVRAGGLF